jgi:hypothetical protein
MPRFLIELPHESEHSACVRALDALSKYGSHFITNASWGCAAGVHCGYLITELASREEAQRIIPPQFRHEARIVEVERYTRAKIETLLARIER